MISSRWVWGIFVFLLVPVWALVCQAQVVWALDETSEEGVVQEGTAEEGEKAPKTKPTSQQKSASDSEEIKNRVFDLGEIEVVAKEQENKNTTVERVYFDEMRLFDRNELSDAVDLLPGVTLSETGQRNEKTVYIRGFDIKHVPIFLDGIPIYVPYDGYPDLSRFTTFNLSEIVVSKAFTSVLYGPNTMGGAINMVSRRPVKEFEVSSGSGYSSGNTYHGFANVGSNQKKWYVQVGGSYLNSDYFDVSDNFTPTSTQKNGERVNSYRTDWVANVKLGYTPNDTDEYAFSYINQQGEKGDPPYAGTDDSVSPKYWQWPYWDKESFYFNSKTSICDSSYVKSRIFYDKFKNALYSFDDETYSTMLNKYAFKSYYDDYTIGGSLELGTVLLPRNSIKGAFHFKDDVHREHNEGNPTQRFEDQVMSIGIEDTIDITSRFYSIIGLSYDMLNSVEAQDFDSKTRTLGNFPTDETSAFNPQGGLFYKLTDTGTLHATIADKTRLPSMKDKYSYKFGTTLPNPDLKPEESINYEIGYQDVFFKKMKVEMNVFYSDVSDFILYKKISDPDNPGESINQNQNIGDVYQTGVELAVSGQLLSCLQGGFNYTYIQYVNQSNSDKLTNIPHNKVFGYLQYFTPLQGLSFLGSVEFNSNRYSSSDAIRVADQYVLVNTKAIYEIYKGFSVEAGIRNICDENYALDEGYPLEGRNYFMNLRYNF